VQGKVAVLGGLPASTAEAAVQAEHRLNLARHIGKMATRIDRQFLATSDPLGKYGYIETPDRTSPPHRDYLKPFISPVGLESSMVHVNKFII